MQVNTKFKKSFIHIGIFYVMSSDRNDDLKLDSLLFKSGEKPNVPYLVNCQNVIVLVGPNNSGKSSALREIFAYCNNQEQIKRSILNSINFHLPKSDSKSNELLSIFQTNDLPKGMILRKNEVCVAIPDFKGTGEQPEYIKLNKEEFFQHLQSKSIEYFIRNIQFLKNFTVLLDGRTRFTLVQNKPRGDLTLAPSNPLAKLFRDKQLLKKLDEIIYQEFNWHVYLDPTPSNGLLKISLNKKEFQHWQSLSSEAVDFFKTSTDITNFGDGIQVFVGLMIAVLSLPHKMILLDEPEAFLHPPKARSIGAYLSKYAIEKNNSLIVSTHSPEFLMGCLDSSTDVTIIRMTYDGQIGTTRNLIPNDVKSFTTDPLLRSSDTVSALFHSSAVVTEADGDRVFYAEINRRMMIKQKGIEDTRFLNSQGKHTVHRLFGPLRKIGIPAVAIYDLDVIKHEKLKNEDITLWAKILSVANISSEKIEELENKRAKLESFLKTVQTELINPFKKKGLNALNTSEKEFGESLLNELKQYGIFIVPSGTLESWTEDLFDESFEKSIWLVNTLEKLEELNPITDEKNIWKFMQEIKQWVQNQEKLGMYFSP